MNIIIVYSKCPNNYEYNVFKNKVSGRNWLFTSRDANDVLKELQ